MCVKSAVAWLPTIAPPAAGESEAKTAETGPVDVTFPVDPTVKVVDAAVNAVTLNQLKEGEKVAVQYSRDQNGKEKAESINVMQ